MNKRKISVIHPSRSRPMQAYETAKKWHEMADGEFEYILALDYDDPKLETYRQLFSDFSVNATMRIDPNRSAIEAISHAAEYCVGDMLIVISDDFDCPEHWDTLLLAETANLSDFLFKTDDGNQMTLVTLPIMDRLYYERFGYVYHPEYKHMFSDQEMTTVALMLGRYFRSQLRFDHLHYSFGRGDKDALNIRNDKTWQQGELLFNERLKTNFGIVDPLIKYEDIIWK